MKFSTIILFSILSLTANELKWVDTQIDAIKPSRTGVSKASINRTKNPFIFIREEKDISKKIVKINSNISVTPNVIKKHSKKMILDVIINTSALINGKWYKHNEKVGKYTLNVIDQKSVLLTYKRKKMLLSIASKNKNLKFKLN